MSATDISLTELIQLRFAARRIDLSSKRRLSRTTSGLKLANFRGRGIDFDQHRIYQPGDDIRAIDWRVTARTGKPHTKIFREEQERPVLIVVDYTSSMWFGTQRAFKAVTAAEAAAVLAWSAFNNHDRVGGQIFTEQADVECRPTSGRGGVLKFLHQLATPQLPTMATAESDTTVQTTDKTGSNASRAEPLADSLANLRRVVRPGTLIFLLSDCYHLSDAAIEQAALLSAHSELFALHIVDPIESTVPPRGIYPISDGERIRMAALISKKQRLKYLEPYQQRCAKLAQLREHRIQIRELSTARPVSETLQEVLGGYHDPQVMADVAHAASGAA